jgi:linoleate 8R-lipoxygenase/9,12-octadecadienoate 8-hydroperoxide 8R-isomerase
LREFYDHPDNIELYPGLIVENTKIPMSPGAGLCPNQTIGKAILSDAVALVRGDRFFTVVCFSFEQLIQDYSPSNLTQFGYNAVATDPNVAQGGVLYRLLMRAFPGWYEYNSVFAMFPLTIPSENEKILTDLGHASLYSFKPPTAPVVPTVFSTAQSAKYILGNQQAFNIPWGKAIASLTGSYDFMVSGDRPVNTADHKVFMQALYTDAPKGMDEVWNFYFKKTTQLLCDRSYSLGEYFQVDAVREYESLEFLC